MPVSDATVARGLLSLAEQLCAATEIEKVTSAATHSARSLLGADGISFVLRDNELCYYIDEDTISPLWKGRRFPMEACISGWCMHNRRSVTIEDISQDARIPQDVYQPTFVRSLAMVPVSEANPVGAMGAYWSDVRRPTKSEVKILEEIAGFSALSLANIRLADRHRRDKASAQHQDLLVRELSHRVKNTFSIIESIARQSARHAGSLDLFIESFSGRIRALSGAVDWLIDPQQKEIDLRTTVETIVSPFHLAEGRISACGDHVTVPVEKGMAIALMLHELSTNALKYGALAASDGVVRIRWSAQPTAGAVRIRIVWEERGGQPVVAPAKKGFGTTMLRRATRHALDGTVDLDFAAQGLTCSIDFSLDRPART